MSVLELCSKRTGAERRSLCDDATVVVCLFDAMISDSLTASSTTDPWYICK